MHAPEPPSTLGRDKWMHGFSDRDREQEYVRTKGVPMNEQYANESIGASVRLMIRGGSLPVRGDDKMKWKYKTDPYRLCLGLNGFNLFFHEWF